MYNRVCITWSSVGSDGMNDKDIWVKFLELVEGEITSILYETWFKETTLHKIKDNKVITVPFAEISKCEKKFDKRLYDIAHVLNQ